MKITYYALRDIQVGDEIRGAGMLIPEAADWPYLSGYVRDGHVAPVLVVTLPEAAQQMLAKWEADQYGTPTPAAPTSTPKGDGATATKTSKEKVA